MRVLVCISNDSERSGGSFRVAEVTIRSLMKVGVDVHAVIGYGPGGRIKEILGEKCHLLNAKSSKDISGWLRMRRVTKTICPDVIHFASASNWMIASSIGLKPARIMHQHFRPNIGPNGSKHIRHIKWKMMGAQKIIAISHEAARQLVTLCGIPKHKVATIHNAIDTDYLNVAPIHVSNIKRLGMAVRIVEDKGVEDAIELLTLLPENFILTVAGDGPALHRLKSLAEQKGLSSRIEWLGLVADIESFYSKIDYYLFLSWYEGFGLSVAEAMACGIPVVGLLGDGEISEPEYPLVTAANSQLIPRSSAKFCREMDHGTLKRLSDAIVVLNGNESARAIQIENAKRWIVSRFSSDLYGERIIQVYNDAVSFRGRIT